MHWPIDCTIFSDCNHPRVFLLLSDFPSIFVILFVVHTLVLFLLLLYASRNNATLKHCKNEMILYRPFHLDPQSLANPS